MTELNFLDSLANQETHNATENTDTENTETTPQVGPDTTVTAPTDAPESKYPNVVATYASLDEVPEDLKLHTPAEFAGLLTVRNVTTKNMGLDGIVKDSAVNSALRAVRHPLPVVLVGETAYLSESAFTDWDNRPVRGEGATGGGGRLSDDDLLKAAASARDSVDSLTRRLDSIKTRLAKAETLRTKRTRQLTERFAGESETSLWERVDAWASANEATVPDGGATSDDSQAETETAQAA